MDKLIVEVVLTGAWAHKADNSALPITPEEVAADARRCADEGATVFRVHARNEYESPVMSAGWHRRYVEAVRAVVPDAVVCVPCGTRGGFEERAAALLAGPDVGSLMLGSVDFETGTAINERRMVRALARRMKNLGVVPECEIYDLGHAFWLCRENILPDRFWFAVIYGPCLPATAFFDDIVLLVGADGVPLFFGGTGCDQWDANQMAIRRGFHVRTGLGENLEMDNPNLVRRVVEYARAVGREPATREELEP